MSPSKKQESHQTVSLSDWPDVAETFSSCSETELLAHKWDLQHEVLKIRHQLDLRDAEEKDGKDKDLVWRAKATMALEARKLYLEEINDRLYLMRKAMMYSTEPPSYKV